MPETFGFRKRKAFGDLVLLKYALKELRSYPRYTLLFVINIMIGLIGLSAIESFNASINREVKASSQASAGGDLVVSSRLTIDPKTLQTVQSELGNTAYEFGEAEEVLTMASTQEASRLLQLRAQSANLPFYGTIEVEPLQTSEQLETGHHCWVSPELLTQLNLNVGDSVSIGGLSVKITGVIKKDSAPQLGRGALAPRAYVSRATLTATGLVQKGSTVFYQKVFKLPAAIDSDELAKRISSRLKDSTLNIRSHSQASEASARMLSYLNDYLGLISLVALLLSNIGGIYLFRAHLIDRLKDMSVLKMIGMRPNKIIQLYSIEVLLLSFAGVVLALLGSLAIFPLINSLASDILPFNLAIRAESSAFILVAIVGMVSTLFCLLPLLLKIRTFSPSELFQESFALELKLNARALLLWLPAVLFFYALSIWQANSIKVASLFVVSLLLSAAALSVVGLFIFKAASPLLPSRSFEVRFAFRELIRRPLENLTTFVALAIGAMLASLVFTIEGSISSEFEIGAGSLQPSLFLFDIQEDQIEGVRKLGSKHGVELVNNSPMVRARLTAINDSSDFTSEEASSLQTREEQQAARSRNRTFNLTERAKLSTSETLIEGREFLSKFDPASNRLPEISLEERFSERLSAKIGDKFTFEIMGVELKAEVVSIRRVKWASFQPNFFIQFQEGVLTEMPKVYLASTNQLSNEVKARYQQDLVREFPNVSIIDVSQAVAQLLETTTKMALALKIMAFLVLFASLLVVTSIQIYNMQRSKQQKELLRLVGLVKRRLQVIANIQSWSLILFALSFGWILSFAVAWPITSLMFARTPTLTFESLITLILLVPLALATSIGSWKAQ